MNEEEEEEDEEEKEGEEDSLTAPPLPPTARARLQSPEKSQSLPRRVLLTPLVVVCTPT